MIKGYRIEIKGKMNGRPRKKKRVISSGPMPFSSINSNINYFFSESFTKYGVFGIKVWLFF
jgi:small subunit ribosomal protein S3